MRRTKQPCARPPVMPGSEFYSQVKLHPSAFRRAGHSAVIGAGDAGVGIAPADEVERVVDIRPELSAEPFLDREHLANRNRFRFLRPSAHPIESRSGIAALI